MSERWKPREKYEKYFYLDEKFDVKVDLYVGIGLDNCRVGNNNCFKTEAEAQATAEKIKAILGLQDSIQDKQPVTNCNQLPSWVEVGGYVYDPRNGYGKIVSGSVKSCRIEFNGGAGFFTPEDFAEFKQARLRPYNKEELRLLVGRIVCERDGTGLLLVTAYNAGDDVEPPEPAIMTLNDWTTASELLNNGYTVNNEPCGVFEHRNEAGEWVE